MSASVGGEVSLVSAIDLVELRDRPASPAGRAQIFRRGDALHRQPTGVPC